MTGRLREVVILQIADRDGFSLLISELSTFGAHVRVEPVPEGVYNLALHIETCYHSAPPQYAQSSHTNENTYQNRRSHQVCFPLHLIRDCAGRMASGCSATHPADPMKPRLPSLEGDALEASHACVALPTTSVQRSSLKVKSAREDFALLRISKYS